MSRTRAFPHRLFRVAFFAYLAVVVAWLVAGLLVAVLAGRYDLLAAVSGGAWPRWVRDLVRGFTAYSTSVEFENAHAVLDYAFAIAMIALALLLLRLRGEQLVVRLVAVGLVGSAGAFNLTAHGALDVVLHSVGIDIDLWHILLLHCVAGFAFVYALVLFPDGRVPWRRPRRLARLLLLPVLLLGNAVLFFFAVSTGTAHALAFVIFYGLLAPATGVVTQWVRMRHAATPQARAASRLLLGTLLLGIGVAVALAVLSAAVSLSGLAGFGVSTPEGLVFVAFRALVAAVPLALLLGVARHRLWDLDRLLSRAVGYSLLALFAGLGYVGLAVALTRLPGETGAATLGVSLLTTVLVTLALAPLHGAARRLADRLVHGRRPDAYRLLTSLAAGTVAEPDPADALRAAAEAIARGVGADACELDAGSVRGHWPEPPVGRRIVLPVQHRGEPVGELRVSGDRLGPAARDGLAQVQDLVGPVLAVARADGELRAGVAESAELAAQLQRSGREVLVGVARERRHLERDIHDAAQQLLLSLRLEIAALQSDPGARDRVATALGRAEQGLHELASGLGPSALRTGALAAALADLTAAHPAVHTVIDPAVPTEIDPGAARAAYFGGVEAIQNALHHGGGGPVELGLSIVDGDLALSVTDHGPGFDAGALTPGGGLAGIRDRLDRLGGHLSVDSSPAAGTTVRIRVPAAFRAPA